MVRRKYEKDELGQVTYAKTETLSVLRNSILPSLLGNLSDSLQATMPQRIFELGSVFSVEAGKPIESRKAAFVSEHPRSNFSEIKAAVYEFMKMVGSPKFALKGAKDSCIYRRPVRCPFYRRERGRHFRGDTPPGAPELRA